MTAQPHQPDARRTFWRPEKKDRPHHHNVAHVQPVISIRGLRKAFGDKEVLRGVDLDLYKGENVVVLGRSGTGKSVLIKVIVGLLKPDAGSVTVLGQDVPSLRPGELDALRLRIGFSFQNSALYDSMNVRQKALPACVMHLQVGCAPPSPVRAVRSAPPWLQAWNPVFPTTSTTRSA